MKLSVTDGLVTALSLAGAGESGTGLPLMNYGYQDGNLTTVTKPSGATTTFAYDDRHRVIAWIDSNNSRYDYIHDDCDRVIAEDGEAGHVQITLPYTEPDPEPDHRTTVLTTADGRATRHLFGPGCRLPATIDPLGNTTLFHYGPSGDLQFRTDPLGRTTAFSYDEEDRLVTVARPDGPELRVVRARPAYPRSVTIRTAPGDSRSSTSGETARRSPIPSAVPSATPTTSPVS